MEKTIHFALFLFLVTGILFTGCTPQTPDTAELDGSLEESLVVDEESSDEEGMSDADESVYKDGTYTQSAEYVVPDGKSALAVTLVLKDGVVESVAIENQAKDDVSIGFVQLFSEGISSVVVGKSIDEIDNVGAVNGSSLTPVGFNTAVQAIMEEASA